ncbi:MAG: alpha-amylase family glycosyl hydrolase [Bacilli bacterium]|nr:alpha-amylase family glycosyl hydrolase [Bacilli bacterium]
MKQRNELFKDLIFYEIYPTSFYDSNSDGIGDLMGIKKKLSYIKELGCNAIWLNPFFVSPFRDGGYDISDFFNVDSKFGTMRDFDDLIKEAKKLKIKIILDCVAGHTSNISKEFIESSKEKKNKYSDLFIWNNNVWHMESGYKLVSGCTPRNGNFLVNFFAFQPALNYGFNKIEYPEWQMSYRDQRTYQARNFIIKFMKFWLKKGVAGFRVDMADSLVKNDKDKSATIEVWRYIFKKVKNDYPNAFFVSEWSNPNQSFRAGFDCDFVLNHWHNFYHHLARSTKSTCGVSVLNGGDSSVFIKDLKWRYSESIKNHGYLGIISGNHDTTRVATFLSLEKLKMFYMFMFMMPGIPFLYYGDEIMMKNATIANKDGGYTRTGARTPMQWDESKNAGFSKASTDKLYLPVNKGSKTNLIGNLNDKNSLYYTIKTLIKIRKNNPSILNATMTFNVKNNVINLNRGNLRLILNCSKKDITVKNKILYSTGKNKTIKPNEGAIIII